MDARGDERGRVGGDGGPAAQRLSPARCTRPVPTGGADGEGSSAAAVGERAAPPPCRSLFEDKASVSDITIAPFPRRAPPVKSFVAVPNKSLVQVVLRRTSLLQAGSIVNLLGLSAAERALPPALGVHTAFPYTNIAYRWSLAN